MKFFVAIQGLQKLNLGVHKVASFLILATLTTTPTNKKYMTIKIKKLKKKKKKSNLITRTTIIIIIREIEKRFDLIHTHFLKSSP